MVELSFNKRKSDKQRSGMTEKWGWNISGFIRPLGGVTFSIRAGWKLREKGRDRLDNLRRSNDQYNPISPIAESTQCNPAGRKVAGTHQSHAPPGVRLCACVTSGPGRFASGSECRAVRVLSSQCDRAAVPAGEEYPLPRAEKDEEGTWERAAAGLGRSGAGWRLCSFACCCLWEPGASTEESSADSKPLPRLPCPPCRGGRKMPVKKKRKSPGVAAAVAEDGGLKKCKISSYCRSQPPARLISGEEHFSSKKCLAWFYEYAGPDEVVGPEGMEKFCEDIGVEPENIIMLVLAWKLEAESMGFFTKEEWLKGMTSLQKNLRTVLLKLIDSLDG
eukprot:bmy_14916T0